MLNWRKKKTETLRYRLANCGNKDGIETKDAFSKGKAEESLSDDNIHDVKSDLQEFLSEELEPIQTIAQDVTALRFYNINGECLCNGIKQPRIACILNEIQNSTLGMGKINFNDAMDPLLSLFLRLSKQQSSCKHDMKWYKTFDDACQNLRICCLCLSYAKNTDKAHSVHNQLMWAHYACNHTGIAVEYTITPDQVKAMQKKNVRCFLQPIRYKKKNVSINDVTLEESLFLKSKTWAYENEYRLVYYRPNPIKDFVQMPCTIKAVYLGVKITKKHQREVINTLKDTSIPIYRMVYQENDMMNLRVVGVKHEALHKSPKE